MADHTPAEDDLNRDGPQLTAGEARARAAHDGTVRGPADRGHTDRDVPLDADAGLADAVRPRVSPAHGASGGTGNAPRGERPPDDRPFTDSETALGGADAIQKTTWGVGHGAEPDGLQEHAPVGLRKGEGTVVSRVAPGGGVSPVIWGVGIIAAIALVLYAVGIFG